jgi:hypothetical protein
MIANVRRLAICAGSSSVDMTAQSTEGTAIAQPSARRRARSAQSASASCYAGFVARRFAIKTTFEGAVAHEVRYWLRQTIEDRISGVEVIRRAAWSLYGGAPTRMARVSRNIEAPWRPVPAHRRIRRGGARSAAVHAGSRRPGRSHTRQRAARGRRDQLDLALLDELALARKPVRAKNKRRR